jgi:hypothetical protein
MFQEHKDLDFQFSCVDNSFRCVHSEKIITFVRFKVFTVVTMKIAVLWDLTQCGSCKNQHFRGTCHLHYQGGKNQ